MKKRVIVRIVIFVLIAAVLWVADSAMTKITPGDLTRSVMRCTQVRLLDYYRVHTILPSTLSDLPDIPEHEQKDGKMEDAWGVPIIYHVEDGQVTLKSLGKDGLQGGDGLDRDIVLVFDPDESKLLESFTSN